MFIHERNSSTVFLAFFYLFYQESSVKMVLFGDPCS